MTTPQHPIIARGRTAEVLAWQDGQVLKLFYDWMNPGGIDREAHAARLVSATDLPTPKMLGELTLQGRRGLIYERVSGQSLLKALTSQPWQISRLGCQLAELQASLHQRSGSGLPALKDNLGWDIGHLKGVPPGPMSAALKHLSQMPDGDTLCHFDFHPDQVMLTPTGPVVLDWMNACAGDPSADVARTVMLLKYGSAPDTNRLLQMIINRVRNLFFSTYLRRYLQLNPSVTPASINAWLPLVCLARLSEGIPGDLELLWPIIEKAFPLKK